MAQPLPVIRDIYLPGLLPQFAAIATLAFAARLIFPNATISAAALAGMATYLVASQSLRRILTREHRRGMAAYRAGDFQKAISHFEINLRYFSSHPKLDAWRSLIFAVASRNSYRVMAIGNIAYCSAHLGDGAKAIELYEQVLREVPDHAVAKASLKMLRYAPAISRTSSAASPTP
jgi:tetratricopeptide (TPR) repeat protein